MRKIHSSNVIIYCRNFTGTAEFYRNVLELNESMRLSWMIEFMLTDTSFITVADENRASIKSSYGAGITLAIRVDDADRFHKFLTDKGTVPGEVTDYPPSTRRFFIHDPEGNRIEIWSQSSG